MMMVMMVVMMVMVVMVMMVIFFEQLPEFQVGTCGSFEQAVWWLLQATGKVGSSEARSCDDGDDDDDDDHISSHHHLAPRHQKREACVAPRRGHANP